MYRLAEICTCTACFRLDCPAVNPPSSCSMLFTVLKKGVKTSISQTAHCFAQLSAQSIVQLLKPNQIVSFEPNSFCIMCFRVPANDMQVHLLLIVLCFAWLSAKCIVQLSNTTLILHVSFRVPDNMMINMHH